MTTREPENPLIIHCMILFAVALGSVGYGVYGLIQSIRAGSSTTTTASTTSSTGNTATDASRKISQTDAEISRTSSDARTLTQKPSLSGAATQIQAAGRLAAKAKAVFAYLVPALFIAAGIAMFIAALKVMSKADWARILALGCLAAVLCGFAAIEGGRFAAAGTFTWQLAVVGVGALLAGWIGWNLAVEKFEQAPGVPAVLGLAIVPLLLGGVGAPLYVVSNAPEKPAASTGPAGGTAAKEEEKADKYSWRRVDKGTSLMMKSVNDMPAPVGKQESQVRWTLLDKDDTNATVKMEVLAPDGKVTFEQTDKQPLTFKKGDDEEILEEKSETVEVPAGKYDCEYKKIKKSGEQVLEVWLFKDLPMPPKMVTTQPAPAGMEGKMVTTMELIEVKKP